MSMTIASPLVERILKRVEKDADGCWVFTGATTSVGYGNAYVAPGRWDLTHRIVYEHFVRPLEPGEFVCHRCDVRACCNPEHLFAGSQKDNVNDMHAKGRHSHGAEHSAKLRACWTDELRDAQRERMRARMAAAHAEAATAAGVPVEWKRCPQCDTWKPRSEFHRNAARDDGIKPYCKPCSIRQSVDGRRRRP